MSDIKTTKEQAFPRGAIIFALFFIFNPTIAFFDILPDFIGCLVLLKVLEFPARRVPFFEEARRSLIKLTIVSLARFPAFLLSTFIRSANTMDGDIIVLLTWGFSILEAIFAFGLIGNLFAGISHLGLRTGKASIIGKNPSADSLRTISYVFIAVKCAASAIPELARLTSADSIGTITTGFESLRYYPIMFVIGQSLGYVIGLAWLAYFVRYLTNIKASGEYREAVLMLSDDDKEKAIGRQTRLDKIRLGLNFMVPAAFISFDFSLKQARNVNILPHFILGILLLLAVIKFTTVKSKTFVLTVISGCGFILSSLAAWITTIIFYDKYTYTDIKMNEKAPQLYRVCEFSAAIELVCFILFIVAFTLLLISFIKRHTGRTHPSLYDPLSDVDGNDYTAFDKNYHKALTVRAWIFAAIGILGGAARCLAVFIKAEREFAYGALIPTVAPWFGVIELALAAVWGFYTYMFVGTLTEDFSMKYASIKPNYETDGDN